MQPQHLEEPDIIYGDILQVVPKFHSAHCVFGYCRIVSDLSLQRPRWHTWPECVSSIKNGRGGEEKRHCAVKIEILQKQ